MGRLIQLKEYVPVRGVPLTADERDAISSLVPDIQMAPTPGTSDSYDLRATSTIGVARSGDLTLEIVPRLPLERILFLASYSTESLRWPTSAVGLSANSSLVEAVAQLFVRSVDSAVRHGLLHGYVHVDDRLTTIRGRVRFADQLSRWNGEVPPVELSYDDYTSDVLENRLLKAAMRRLAMLGTRSAATKAGLQRLHHLFSGITAMPFDATFLPNPAWNRLNEHYQPAVELARLILSGGGLEARAGARNAPALLFNMAEVFEHFVHVALREALNASPSAFPRNATKRRLRLDEADRVVLRPDLSLWEGERCIWVGDCKYKRTDSAITHADLYQLLAYTVATDLPSGLLVYAAGEADPTVHVVNLLGKQLHVRTLDLAGTEAEVLSQIEELAELTVSMTYRRGTAETLSQG